MKTRDFVRRVEAIKRLEIRARVNGSREAVLFNEGELIKEGDPLYRIEKGLFQAELEQAQGALARSKATSCARRGNGDGAMEPSAASAMDRLLSCETGMEPPVEGFERSVAQ